MRLSFLQKLNNQSNPCPPKKNETQFTVVKWLWKKESICFVCWSFYVNFFYNSLDMIRIMCIEKESFVANCSFLFVAVCISIYLSIYLYIYIYIYIGWKCSHTCTHIIYVCVCVCGCVCMCGGWRFFNSCLPKKIILNFKLKRFSECKLNRLL